jgi:hypothetical protein
MDVNALKAAGFVETVYKGQSEVFLTKKMPVADMPYAREHIVDNEYVFDTDTAIIEVVPDPLFPGCGVQLAMQDSDYVEDAVSVSSEEGLALLRDAGVDC